MQNEERKENDSSDVTRGIGETAVDIFLTIFFDTLLFTLLIPLFPPDTFAPEKVLSNMLEPLIIISIIETLRGQRIILRRLPCAQKYIWENPTCVGIALSLACYFSGHITGGVGLLLFMAANVVFAIVAAYATFGVTKMLKKAS